jgi:hypothetical protein
MEKKMRSNMLALVVLVTVALLAGQDAKAVPPFYTLNSDGQSDTPGSKGGAVLSETDNYLDINTGKTFHVIYDDLNEKYNRDDLFAFDLYVNTRTKDTFWLEQALLVNNALLVDAGGIYKVDPMKVKRDGDGYKVKIPIVSVSTKNGDKENKGNTDEQKVTDNAADIRARDQGTGMKSTGN